MTTIRDIIFDIVVDCIKDLGLSDQLLLNSNESQEIINDVIKEYLED